MIFEIESYRRGIILSSAFNLVSRLLLFAQSVVIAHYFPSEETDIFFFCFSSIVLLGLFINGLDSTLIIPEWTRIARLRSGNYLAEKYVNSFVLYYMLIGLAFFVPVSFFPEDVLSACSEFEPSVILSNSALVSLFGPLLGLMILTSLMANVLVANKYFTLPAVLSASNSLLAISGTVLFHERLGSRSIVIGLLVSHGITLFVLVVLMRRRLRWKFERISWLPKYAVLKRLITAQLGHLASFSSSFAPLYLFSGLDKGILTALIYGQRVAEIPSQLIVNQFSVVMGIKFNELMAKGSQVEAGKAFISAAKALIYVTLPLSFLGVLLAKNIVDLFYGSRMFDAQQVVVTSRFLQYFVVLLPLLSINTLVIRLCVSAGLIREILIYQVVLNFVLVVLTYFLVDLVGPLGYPISHVVSYSLITLCVGLIWKQYFPFVGFWDPMKYFAGMVAVNGLVFTFTILLTMWINGSYNIARMIFATSLYLTILLIVTYAFSLNREISSAISSFRARLGF